MYFSLDLTKKKFGRLLPLRIVGKDNQRNNVWLCRCKCGNKVKVRSSSLTSGNTLSCGCYHSARSSETLRSLRLSGKGNNGHKPIHGMSKTSEYSIWCGMLARCYNPKNGSYRRYGGRGIKVCNRWKHSFVDFFADMGFRPSLRYSLGRKRNNGNYTPSNCSWETREEQSNNRSSNIILTYKGESMTLTQWSRRAGLPKTAIQSRLNCGWRISRALTTPLRKQKTKGLTMKTVRL